MIQNMYFLGGISPDGFRTEFSKLINEYGFYTYILKGGPGTGKSTLMKQVAENFPESIVSVYHCSSDPKSLDAVIIEDKKIIVVDGTSPHIFDAVYPGVSQEIVNLGEFWDKEKLKKSNDSIISSFRENQRFHKRAKCYIDAASSINDDIFNIAVDALNIEKLVAYMGRLSKKLIPKPKSGAKGKVTFKQISAFTPDGYITLPIKGEYSRYFIKDELFAGNDFFLRSLTDIFTAHGYDVTVSEFNIIHNSIYEHIVVPQLGLIFITGNFFNSLNADNENIINFSRFYSKDVINAKKQRIAFNKKASAELAEEAKISLENALKVHDILESYYISALDFDGLNNKTKKIVNEIYNH